VPALDYLDDRRALRQVLDGLKRKGFGIHRIRHELLKRGLAGDEANAVRLRACARGRRSVARRVCAEKVEEPPAGAGAGKRRLRLMRFLRSRGFSNAVIYDVMETMEGAACEPPPV